MLHSKPYHPRQQGIKKPTGQAISYYCFKALLTLGFLRNKNTPDPANKAININSNALVIILGPPDAFVVAVPFTSARGAAAAVVGIIVGDIRGESVGDGEGVFFFTTAATVGFGDGMRVGVAIALADPLGDGETIGKEVADAKGEGEEVACEEGLGDGEALGLSSIAGTGNACTVFTTVSKNISANKVGTILFIMKI